MPDRLWLAALVCALAGGAGPAAAAPPATDRCIGSADEAALLACRKAELAKTSQRLQQALDKLRDRYQDDEPERWKLLSAAQQAWRDYSRAECRFRHQESAGGAAYQAYLLSCQNTLGEQRLQDLQAVLARP